MVAVLCFTSFDMNGLLFPPTTPPKKNNNKMNKKNSSNLDSLSTREQIIRVVGFVLKKLFTHFEMLIVLHASHCVNGHYFYSVSFVSLIYCSGLSVR